MKSSMDLSLTVDMGHLSGIPVAQKVRKLLAATHRNQHHLIVVGDKGLGLGIFIVQKMHPFRVLPVGFGLLGIAFGIVRHDLQTFGVGNLFAQQMERPALLKLGRRDHMPELALQDAADAAWHGVGRWCGRFVRLALTVKRRIAEYGHHRQVIGIQGAEGFVA